MTPLLLAAFFTQLSAPSICPKDVGQMRWHEVAHRFKAGGKTIEVMGSIWDRDTDGKPSKGDLMRIEQVAINGRDAGADELWVVIKGSLARGLAKSVAKAGDSLNRTCESRFEVQKVPSFSSAPSLGRYLKGQLAGDQVKMDPLDEVRGTMSSWAEKICEKSRVHMETDQLSAKLMKKGGRKFRKHGKRAVQAIADEVASEFAFACARLDKRAIQE